MSNIPVVFSPAAEDACSFYRMWMPSLNIPNSDFYFTGWNTDRTPKKMDLQRVMDKKVMIVQRQGSVHNLQAMRNVKRLGLKVVYDLDDNIWDLPHGNPAKKPFQVYRDWFAACAAEADLLTVSTQGLKTAVGANFINRSKTEILVVPNAIDFKLFQKKEVKRDDGFVVIGWGGSNTHNDDVKDVFAIIPQILDSCPNAVMEIAGMIHQKEIKQTVKVLDILERDETIPKTKAELKKDDTVKTKKVKMPYALLIEDVKTKMREEVPWKEFKGVKGHVMSRQVLVPSDLSYHPKFRLKHWIPIREYPNRLASWSWDIAIAPLEDFRFNKSKSNIKMLEAAALKIPCLVSNIQPYIEFCALGGTDLNWLVCHSIPEWAVKLRMLVNEPERREYLGNKMYEVAKKYFDIEVICSHWQYAFQKVTQ